MTALTASPQNQRDRRLILISGILLLFAVAIFLFYEGLRKRLDTAAFPAKGEVIWVEQSPEMLASLRKRALRMRELWEPWAREHAIDIRKMLAGDQAAFDRVYRALPASSWDISEEFDKQFSQEPTFCWNVKGENMTLGPDVIANNPQALQKHQQADNFASRLLEAKFAQMHDLPLGSSTYGGRTRYTFWASGRVTETNLPFRPARNAVFQADEHTVASPYHFLDSRNTMLP